MTALLAAMGAAPGPLAADGPPAPTRPRRPIVLRFPDGISRQAWFRLTGLMAEYRCLHPNARRLSRFLAESDDVLDWEGRVSRFDAWTGREHGGAELAEHYSNWTKRTPGVTPCAPSAFRTDMAMLRAAGLVELAHHTTAGRPQGYVLVISTTAIERLPENSLGTELAALCRIDLMAAAWEAGEPEDDVHVGGSISSAVAADPDCLLLEEPVSLAQMLTFEGSRSEEFAKQLAAQAAAEFALAPRWEHPASSPAARVAAAVRAETAGHDELAATGLQELCEDLNAAVASGCDGEAVDILISTAMHDALAAVAAVGRTGRERLLDMAVAHQLGAVRGAVAALQAAVAASDGADDPVVAARLLTAHAALDALLAAGVAEALAHRPPQDPDAVVVSPAAYAVAAPEPEGLYPARNRRRPEDRPVDNRPAGRARKTMIHSDTYYPRGPLSLPSGFLPAVTRVRAYQRADGKAKPKTTPQRAAGPEFNSVELRAGGGFALAIRRRWKATAGLPAVPDTASWDDDGGFVTTPEWVGFVRAITLALQRCDRDHVWLRATEDLMTCDDLVLTVCARLWKEIIKPRPWLWPANKAPRRAARYGTSVAGAAAEWCATAAGDDDVDPDARLAVTSPGTAAEPEPALARLHAEADTHRQRAEPWGMEQRIAAQLAADGWTPPAAEKITRSSGDVAGRPPRSGQARSRTVRRPDFDFDPEREQERIRLNLARHAAAEQARAAAEAAAREALDRRVSDLHARWGVTADVQAAQAAAARAADIEAGPVLSPGESQARAQAEANRQRGRRTVADRARAILGEEGPGNDDQR